MVKIKNRVGVRVTGAGVVCTDGPIGVGLLGKLLCKDVKSVSFTAVSTEEHIRMYPKSFLPLNG